MLFLNIRFRLIGIMSVLGLLNVFIGFKGFSAKLEILKGYQLN